VLYEKEKKLPVLLFDLGFTLINFEGCPIDAQKFAAKFSEIISEYHRCRAVDLIERPVEEFFEKTLTFFSIENLPTEVTVNAINAMYTYTESWWKVEKDAHETLRRLKAMGYRMGLISNASNSPDLNRLIDNHRLRDYFEIIVISADEGIRKPDPQIFLHTLSRMGVKPEDAIMIGDTLPADILGARNVGMRSVWITRRADRQENSEVAGTIQPDFEIEDLSSLVDLVAGLNGSARP
jgi:HAD superfamily hydrolase (TIGR01662 family)